MKIYTHNGGFHADEVFAVAFLRMFFGFLGVVRTRCLDDMTFGDIVVDVGGIYDPEKGFFDHHQREGAGERENGVPYSSFGLVWKSFGLACVDEDERVFEYVDEALVQGIDAIDCGKMVSTNMCGDEDVNVMSVSSLISGINPMWNEEVSSDKEDEAFMSAVVVAEIVLRGIIGRAQADSEARKIVEQAVLESSDRIMTLPKFCPWQRHLAELDDTILYVVFPDARSETWRVQCVPETPGSMVCKKPLPKSWWGLRDQELANVTGATGAIFCHRNGFIAGNRSILWAEQMAYDAVQD